MKQLQCCGLPLLLTMCSDGSQTPRPLASKLTWSPRPWPNWNSVHVVIATSIYFVPLAFKETDISRTKTLQVYLMTSLIAYQRALHSCSLLCL